MDQNKPSKSITWIVATIWANIIIVSIIFVVIFFIISFLINSTGSVILLKLYLRGNLLVWIFYLLVLASEIFGIWLGVRTVLKRSSVKHEDHIKISIITGLVAPTIVIILAILSFILVPRSYLHLTFTFSQILQLLFSAACIGLITYYWLKKLNH